MCTKMTKLYCFKPDSQQFEHFIKNVPLLLTVKTIIVIKVISSLGNLRYQRKSCARIVQSFELGGGLNIRTVLA